MSDLNKRELLKRTKQMEKKNEVPKEIRSIDEALKEKEIRETQNLKIKLEQDRLCAEMKNMEQIASILNSTSNAQAGCPLNRENEEYHHVACDNHVSCGTHIEEVHVVEGHPVGCHCEKCCPNPKPTWIQKHRTTILMALLWLALIILAIGWSPSGETFDAIQKSYVELIVNFFKMAIFAVAGVVTYKLTKKKDE